MQKEPITAPFLLILLRRGEWGSRNLYLVYCV